MEQKRNALIEMYEVAINNNDISNLDTLYTEDYINHAAPFGLPQDLNGLKILFQTFIEAFPDQHITPNEVLTHGDRTIIRWTLTGTHTGTFFGTPPTGKHIEMTGIDIERIQDGKIAEHWGGEDMLGLLQQIGAIPSLKWEEKIAHERHK